MNICTRNYRFFGIPGRKGKGNVFLMRNLKGALV